ncbi:MAG TPA: SRPBCC family protein [Candidatus Limnocylindrales bacterium]|nr:SRPBCC family protein [Candidatus Limnocylindrales bacterium]
MHTTASFDIPVPPDRVVAYLSRPRNLLIANHVGPVIEQSDPPVRRGSWSVHQFDQLRVRVEYIALERDEVAVAISSTGRGSGGVNGSFRYWLAPVDASRGTRVSVEAETPRGLIRDPIGRLLWPLLWHRIRDRMAREA